MPLGDVNHMPRRWTDGSARVRVIEGWHPSRPDRIGYNLLVDGDWIGTFDSLDGAARAAAAQVGPGPMRTRRRPLDLVPYIQAGTR